MKTITQVREAFWKEHPKFAKYYRKTYRQNDYHTDLRVSFTDFVDHLYNSGQISSSLAQRVTL